MLSQLLNIIKDYLTSIEKINTEYHKEYKWAEEFLYSDMYVSNIYNYRTRDVEYSNIHNKYAICIAVLPKNYI